MNLNDMPPADLYELACQLAKVRVFGPWEQPNASCGHWFRPIAFPGSRPFIARIKECEYRVFADDLSELYPTITAAMQAADEVLRVGGAILVGGVPEQTEG